jgi:hypothetical protein
MLGFFVSTLSIFWRNTHYQTLVKKMVSDVLFKRFDQTLFYVYVQTDWNPQEADALLIVIKQKVTISPKKEHSIFCL